MVLLGQKIGGWVNFGGGRRNHEKTRGFCWDSMGFFRIFYISTGTLKITERIFAPENGWLEYDHFLLGWGLLFRGQTGCSF